MSATHTNAGVISQGEKGDRPRWLGALFVVRNAALEADLRTIRSENAQFRRKIASNATAVPQKWRTGA
jgi:hypothetical protein